MNSSSCPRERLPAAGANPEEIVQTALFLLSNDASYINDSILVTDGGITVS